MKSFNKVYVIGRLTSDPEIRSTPQGTTVGDFSIVVKRTYFTPSGEEKEEICFLEIVVWAKKAELCQKKLSKGKLVFVEGRLHLDRWTSQDGEDRSKIKIIAENIQFLE
jgi:single-strand DNA-binding protein